MWFMYFYTLLTCSSITFLDLALKSPPAVCSINSWWGGFSPLASQHRWRRQAPCQQIWWCRIRHFRWVSWQTARQVCVRRFCHRLSHTRWRVTRFALAWASRADMLAYLNCRFTWGWLLRFQWIALVIWWGEARCYFASEKSVNHALCREILLFRTLLAGREKFVPCRIRGDRRSTQYQVTLASQRNL